MGNLTAATAWASITPTEHYAMGGYHTSENIVLALLRPRRSTGVHDDLQARALLLGDGECLLAIVTVDVIGLFQDDVLAIRKLAAEKTGLASLEVIVAAVHTQAAPDTYGIYGGVPQRYRRLVQERAAEAIAQAVPKLAPARLGFATGKLEGRVARRRGNQEGVDPAMAVMAVQGADGQNIATLVNVACHTNILGPQNTLLSADWPFYLREALEKARGGMAFFVNGAVGDLHPLPTLQDPHNEQGTRTFAEAEKMGTIVAQTALAALAHAEFVDAAKIAIAKRDVYVPAGNRYLKILRLLGIIKRDLYDGQARTETWVVGLGPAQIVTIPGQPFYKLGAEVVGAMSGKYRFLFGLANDELAYIVPPDEWDPTRGEEMVSVGIETWPAIRAQIPL